MRKKLSSLVMAAVVLTVSTMWTGNVTTSAAKKEIKTSGKIWVIGDSISSDHDDNSKENEIPITGWGNTLAETAPKAEIENKARSGRSSRSYTREQVYKEVMKKTAEGDVMIIQFGHNDEKQEGGRFTDPTLDSSIKESFKWYLKTGFIEKNEEKGMTTILASSVVRYEFKDGVIGEQSHTPYAKAMKELAEECQKEGKSVYFIDTHEITKQMYNTIGEKNAAKLHAMIGLGSAAQMDTTHYGPAGAVKMASIIAKELRSLGVDCCQKIETAYDMDVTAAEEARKQAKKFDWRKGE